MAQKDKAVRMALAAADAAIQAAQASIRSAHALLSPEPEAAPPQPEKCRFCGEPRLQEFDQGVVVCTGCNKDQRANQEPF